MKICKRRKRKKRKRKKMLFCDPLECFLRENKVKSVSGAQILNDPRVWDSHNIPPMIKMLNINMIQRGTWEKGLGIMIGRCSPDRQHGKLDGHPENVGCSFFSYTNDELRDCRITQISDANTKHGQGKTTNLHITVILGATLHKEDREKQW